MNYMNENTIVLVYGVCPEIKNLITECFDGEKILANSVQLTQNEFNNHIFTAKNHIEFSAHGKDICVHPGGSEIIACAKTLLTTAVSEYYHCKCFIAWGFSHVTVSILMESESDSYGIKTGEFI